MSIARESLRVLLVDDDEFVLSIVKRQLQSLAVGSVSTAGNGNEARELLTHNDAFHLIICDLMMPDSDGVELLREIASLQPDTAIILMSSADRRVLNTAEGIATERGLKVLGTLPKPVTQQALHRLLDQLDQQAETGIQAAKEQLITPGDLQKALEKKEIIIHVQPLIQISDQRLKSVEALARWHSPELGTVPPDVFITIAEASGLINTLTDSILQQSITACAAWRREGLDTRIAINLSPAMLDDLALPEKIASLAQAHELPAHHLMLEVTESGVFRDAATSLDILTRLRLRRFGLALDDYGTGYSSLKQLLAVPFTDLKLDRMFLQGSESDPEKRHVVESTIKLAHDLDLKVTAEGVETEEQLRLLADLGSDYAQGYLIAQPMPPGQLTAWHRDFHGI